MIVKYDYDGKGKVTETAPDTFVCSVCNRELPRFNSGGTGYGTKPTADKNVYVYVCYDCCAIEEENWMRTEGKMALYLTDSNEVTNWTGTLRFRCSPPRIGRHNIARVRRDVWFTGPDNTNWHGVQYGYDTQVVHCRRIK